MVPRGNSDPGGRGQLTLHTRKERVAENERRLAEARRLDEAGERHVWEETEFLCECRQPDCSEVVSLNPSDYANVHEHRAGLYFVSPDHILWNVEAVQPHFTIGTKGFKVVEAPRPESRAPLDIETLKLQRESLASEVAALKADITSLLSQVTTATASAALILGVFGAVQPRDQSTLISVLFAIALLPFIVVVITALSIPDVSHLVEKALNPLKMTFFELAEMQRERETKAPWKHVLSIATYEQMERRETAIRDALRYPLPGVLLPQEDWLILELDKLLRTQEALEGARERAREKRGIVTFFLGVLVVYLGVVVAVAAFT